MKELKDTKAVSIDKLVHDIKTELEEYTRKYGVTPKIRATQHGEKVDISQQLRFLENHWQIQTHRPVTTSKPYLPGLIVFFKKVVRRLLKWYVNPIADQASQVNLAVLRTITAMNAEIEALKDNVNSLRSALNTESISGSNVATFNVPWDLNSFQKECYAPEGVIREKQRSYVEYFRNPGPVLDVGCGRGEFLEILREEGITGIGVDLNPGNVEICNSKGLQVFARDAVSFLENVEDNSLGGVFSCQVVEHLIPVQLIKFLELSHLKLKPGSFLVVETVNPLSLAPLANFYKDLSHVRPIHPDTMKYLFSWIGFSQLRIKYCTPLPDAVKLDLLKRADASDCPLVDQLNKNLEKINEKLFGFYDYFVAGKKGV